MSTHDRTNADLPTLVEMDLEVLQQKVEQLSHLCAALKQENDALKQRQESLVSERTGLISNTEQARHQVETMLTRLKSLEQGM